MKRLLAICLALALGGPAEAALQSATAPAPSSSDRTPPADDANCTTCDGIHLLNLGQYGRAMHIFELRSAAGDLQATTEIGVMYENGLGVPVDYSRARRYYTIARNAGYPFGSTLLGYMYQHGEGVPIDYGRAMRFYHEAITAGGDPSAMNQIGFMLQHGLGAPPNPKEAWCWYMWAEANGHPRATPHLAELAAAGQRPVSDCSVLNQWPMKEGREAVAARAEVRRQH